MEGFKIFEIPVVVIAVDVNAQALEMARLFGASDFLPRLLAVRPGLAQRLTSLDELGREKRLERYNREASAAVRFVLPGAELQLQQHLRRFKYRELARLMAREVVLEAPPQEVGRAVAKKVDLAHYASFLV